MIIEIVFILRGIKDMKLKHKIDKVVSTISERISSGGVSQLEVKAEGYIRKYAKSNQRSCR